MKRVLIAFFVLTSTFAHSDGFTLSSESASGQLSNAQVFKGFGCDGGNESPALSWKNAPEGTKSFAVTMYDKDAPTGGGWWHWLVVNIDKSETELKANAGDVAANIAPKGSLQTVTSFGAQGYGGACPPPGDGDHQYLFTVHALSVERIEVEANSPPNLVGYYINSATIARASTVAYYRR